MSMLLKYKNKYNNKTCRCYLGHNHQSCFEAGYCDQLSMHLKMGTIKEVRYQVTYSFDINGAHITNYIADFVVTDKDGMMSVHEAKGFVTEVYKIKKRLFAALYPEIPFHEIR